MVGVTPALADVYKCPEAHALYKHDTWNASRNISWYKPLHIVLTELLRSELLLVSVINDTVH